MNDAQSSIDVAVYELDLEKVAEALIQAYEEGVPVRLVTDTDNADKAVVRDMDSAGIPIMHRKIALMRRR